MIIMLLTIETVNMMLKRLVIEELFQIGRLYHCGKCKLDGLIFRMDNLSTQMLDHPNLNFLVRKELGKFNPFLYFNLMQDD